MDTQAIIAELQVERDRLDNAIAALRGDRRGSGRRRGRRGPLTAAQRKLISARMKASWAKRKKAA